MKIRIERRVNMPYMPKTLKLAQKVEELYAEDAQAEMWRNDDSDTYGLSEEDFKIYMNPPLQLAEEMYLEDEWFAKELAKYLCLLCGIENIGVKINIE